jgi:hypothetical protein
MPVKAGIQAAPAHRSDGLYGPQRALVTGELGPRGC